MKFQFDGTDKKIEEKEYDVIILGAGPAGITAGIYTGRALLKTLIVEEKMIGGEAASTDRIENYPGFPEGISGLELMDNMKKQAEKFKTQFLMSTVHNVAVSEEKKTVIADQGEFSARTLIVATGSSPKSLGIPGEQKFKGRGISYCATCDAPFFKDKDIAVIGAGNSGIQESLFLLEYVRSIKIIEFLPHMTAEKILQERIKQKNNVTFYLNSKLRSINGSQTVESVTIEKRETGEKTELPVDGVFVWVGLKPNTELFKGMLNLDDYGFILTDEFLKTNIDGIFAAGDVRKKILRQVATSVGDGALSAYSALQYIESLHSES
ncbi:MAG: thioredoxin-disulfide reductase [Candidatus Cloacimonadota bacterium]|nr:MAG: thioredoxin-disulfide reductase [Candidatus Cloacimonadota bacterium]